MTEAEEPRREKNGERIIPGGRDSNPQSRKVPGDAVTEGCQ